MSEALDMNELLGNQKPSEVATVNIETFEDLAAAVHSKRAASGMSLKNVADAAGTSTTTISLLENAQDIPNPPLLDRIVNILGLNVENAREVFLKVKMEKLKRKVRLQELGMKYKS